MAALLVVEDDPVQRKMMQRLLGLHFAVEAVDQFAALDMDWAGYDVALVDVLMAVHDGPWLVRNAAERGGVMPIVIFYSALPVELLQREALGLDSGAYYYLSKTGSVSDLVGTIKALCEY